MANSAGESAETHSRVLRVAKTTRILGTSGYHQMERCLGTMQYEQSPVKRETASNTTCH